MVKHSTQSRPVFSTDYFEIEEIDTENYSNDKPYYRLTGHDSIICCLMDRLGHLVMVRQYRPNLGMSTLEFPAGCIEKNELPISAAHREIAEETGFKCELLPLGPFIQMMNRTNIREYLFFGMNPVAIPGHLPERDLEVITVTREELVEITKKGDYLQLPGLSILQLVQITLGVNILIDSVEVIYNTFKTQVEI